MHHRTPSRGAACELLLMHVTDDELAVVLHLDDRDVPVHVPLDRAARRALQHVHALHGHHPSCGGTARGGAHLLRRALGAAGARARAVLVRPGPEPAFWLQVTGTDGTTDLDLGLVDAVALLLDRRLPVVLTDPDHDPWQQLIDRLLPPGRG